MLLKIENLSASYGTRQVLWDVNLEVPAGTTVVLLGRNGMGKTTLINSIMGLVLRRTGSIFFDGQDICRLEPYQIARLGIGYVPQGRHVFPSLSVHENLKVVGTSKTAQKKWSLSEVYELFPVLREKALFRAGHLSGGEQQMLAVARALMTNPRLLLMDEPSEGLAPLVVRQLAQLIKSLKSELTVLLAEQNYSMAMQVADKVYVMGNGCMVFEGEPRSLSHNEEVKKKWLGI